MTSALIVSLIMVFISSVCLSRALSREWRPEPKDRQAFLIFCGVFGAAGIVQGLATREDVFVFAARIAAGVMLLASVLIMLKKDR